MRVLRVKSIVPLAMIDIFYRTIADRKPPSALPVPVDLQSIHRFTPLQEDLPL